MRVIGVQMTEVRSCNQARTSFTRHLDPARPFSDSSSSHVALPLRLAFPFGKQRKQHTQPSGGSCNCGISCASYRHR